MWSGPGRAAILLAAASLLKHRVLSCLSGRFLRLKRERPRKPPSWRTGRHGEKAGLQRRIRQVGVPLSRISLCGIKAVIIAEDDKFWSHEGFDFEAIRKAIEKDLRKRRLQGGSTISQQLAKTSTLTPGETPSGN